MSTPSPRPGAFTLGNSGPPSSFLRQLLEEINGDDIPIASRRRNLSRSTPTSRTTTQASRNRRSSVWVGGEPIAQDARNKLRVADEARLRRASIQGTDGTPALGPAPRLISPQTSISSPSKLGRRSIVPTHIGLNSKNPSDNMVPRGTLHATSSSAVSSPRRESSCSGSHKQFVQSLVVPIDTVDRAVSPLMFCDIDSDSSSSDSEPPTSATTDGSTQASTWSHGNYATRQSMSRMWWTIPFDLSTDQNVAGKRECDALDQPLVLNKKLRTRMLRGTHSISGPSACRALGDDNRRLIRNAEFIERAPALPESISPDALVMLPELSSFRPDSKPAITPVRGTARRFSVPPNSPSISPETPSWARSLHLVDTDVSIYKGPTDAQRENLLCLYCFSRHGNFSKMLPHGYETCGRAIVLDSHYWESED